MDIVEMIPRILVGVYLLYDKGQVVYVGRSSHVGQRIMSASHPCKRWSAWHFLHCEDVDLAAILEHDLIQLFQPIGNHKVASQRFDYWERGLWSKYYPARVRQDIKFSMFLNNLRRYFK